MEELGYHSVWKGERTWNGVAILARGQAPVLTRTSLPGDPKDLQARYIEAAVGGVLIACLYAPNGNPFPGPKFDYKLAWSRRLVDHAGALFAAGLPVVLAGDFNIVPEPQDIYPTRSMDDKALVQPESRAVFAELLSQGWTDSLRTLQPEGPLWTFWAICGSGGRQIRACAWITCCCRRIWRRRWREAASIGGCGESLRPAIMRRPGSSWPCSHVSGGEGLPLRPSQVSADPFERESPQRPGRGRI
jgi:hypothetical protein